MLYLKRQKKKMGFSNRKPKVNMYIQGNDALPLVRVIFLKTTRSEGAKNEY
jgi:hypothetical protein